MATRMVMGVLCSILVIALWAAEKVECGSPPPASDCSSLVMSMADCLSYVSSGSVVRRPEGSCCSGLKMVLKADAECLCEAFKSSAQMGVSLNVTKALALPVACHVSAPSFTSCGLNMGAAAGATPAVSPSSTGPFPPSSAVSAPTSAAGSSERRAASAPAWSSASSTTAVCLCSLLVTLLAIYYPF